VIYCSKLNNPDEIFRITEDGGDSGESLKWVPKVQGGKTLNLSGKRIELQDKALQYFRSYSLSNFYFFIRKV